jgi:hypothetical protein
VRLSHALLLLLERGPLDLKPHDLLFTPASTVTCKTRKENTHNNWFYSISVQIYYDFPFLDQFFSVFFLRPGVRSFVLHPVAGLVVGRRRRWIQVVALAAAIGGWMEGEGNGVDLWAAVCWLRLCLVVGGRGSQLREGRPGVWLVCCVSKNHLNPIA